MNTLYYISLYNSHENQYARYLVTAPGSGDESRAAALDQAKSANGDRWVPKAVYLVCQTNEEVFREV